MNNRLMEYAFFSIISFLNDSKIYGEEQNKLSYNPLCLFTKFNANYVCEITVMFPVIQESNIYLAEHPSLVGRVQTRHLQVVGSIFPLE